MKKTLSTILLGAGLIFGNLNKAKAQECECQTYNHDADEFPEEIICWKREGFDKTTQEYKRKEMGLTIVYYSDNDNDDFYENMRVFNCHKFGGLSLEYFYINKNTGLIDYALKFYNTSPVGWKQAYDKMSILQIVTREFPIKQKYNRIMDYSAQKLTKEQIYNNVYASNQWSFYGGFGERVKKLINAGKNLDEIKKMVNDERNLWKEPFKQIFVQ